MNIALIPARGGSKGIPRKNIRFLGGFPLIAWAIRSAQLSNVFDRIIVSTDDMEIAQISMELEAEVPFIRPTHYAQDNTLQIETIKHALGFFNDSLYSINSLTLLQPTSPFRSPDDCRNAAALFDQGQGNTVISVCDFSHVQNSNTYCGELDELRPTVEGNKEGSLRQSFSRTWWRNGAIYVFSPTVILDSQSLYTPKILGYEMPIWQSRNIDEVRDFIDAENALSDLRVRNLMKVLFNKEDKSGVV